MKIKFLSFIASFFMVSFVITSCLDDDNNIEYSPDATIHAFALDTAGLGSYKFTICLLYTSKTLGIGTKPQAKRRRHCNLQVCISVSYTHLDVYKRQAKLCSL